ncbi:IMv membrane protein [Cetacean poxvirus 1]|nr:IMv membrane protein [Cetacean poxvirus 1]
MTITSDVLSAILLTILMIIMVVSGSALLFKAFASNRLIVSFNINRIITILEYVAIFIMVPGTISLYSAYIKHVIYKK